MLYRVSYFHTTPLCPKPLISLFSLGVAWWKSSLDLPNKLNLYICHIHWYPRIYLANVHLLVWQIQFANYIWNIQAANFINIGRFPFEQLKSRFLRFGFLLTLFFSRHFTFFHNCRGQRSKKLIVKGTKNHNLDWDEIRKIHVRLSIP